MDYLPRMGRPEPAEGLNCGDPGRRRRLRVIDVTHRHFYGDVRPFADGSQLNDRDTSPTCGRESKRCVRRDGRWDEDGSTPTGRLEKAVQPSHRNGLPIERHEPGEGTDLRPDRTCATRDDFCISKVFWFSG